MTPISREFVVGICHRQPVLVEHSVAGVKSMALFNASSPFFLSSGPYEYANLRYYLLNGTIPAAKGGAGGRPRDQDRRGEEPGEEPQEE